MNAGVEFLDAWIIGYSFAVTLPILGLRIVSSIVSCAAVAILSIPLLRTIRSTQGDPLKMASRQKALEKDLDGDAHEDGRGE